MNYDNRNPVFSFRLTLKQRQKLNKVAKIDKISTNEKARNIIQDYLDNKLVPIQANYQEEKLKLQIQKLKLENQYSFDVYQNLKINIDIVLIYVET